MRTKGEAIKQKIVKSIKELQRLIGITHDEEEFVSLVLCLGREFEKFLKEVVFQSTKNKKTLNELIIDLTNFGVSKGAIDYFHDFRKLYNNYKHSPDTDEDVESCLKKIGQLLTGVETLISMSVGSINAPYLEKGKRKIWILAIDDYIGGMTEINLIIPDYTTDFPLAIEQFNIDLSRWEIIKNRFVASGELFLGKEYVSEKAYNTWKNIPDLLAVGSFTGELVELAKEIARHINIQKEFKLMDFHQRALDKSSVITSIVFSTFDTLRKNCWQRFPDFIEEVKSLCFFDFGISLSSKVLLFYLEEFNEKLIQENKDMLSEVNDIIWTDEKGFEKSTEKFILNDAINLKFDLEKRLIIRIK